MIKVSTSSDFGVTCTVKVSSFYLFSVKSVAPQHFPAWDDPLDFLRKFRLQSHSNSMSTSPRTPVVPVVMISRTSETATFARASTFCGISKHGAPTAVAHMRSTIVSQHAEKPHRWDINEYFNSTPLNSASCELQYANSLIWWKWAMNSNQHPPTCLFRRLHCSITHENVAAESCLPEHPANTRPIVKIDSTDQNCTNASRNSEARRQQADEQTTRIITRIHYDMLLRYKLYDT